MLFASSFLVFLFVIFLPTIALGIIEFIFSGKHGVFDKMDSSLDILLTSSRYNCSLDVWGVGYWVDPVPGSDVGLTGISSS